MRIWGRVGAVRDGGNGQVEEGDAFHADAPGPLVRWVIKQ
jgi:hypothetical protein